MLGVKIALALYMFYVVRIVRRGDYAEQQAAGVSWLGRAARRLSSPMALLVIGIVVIGLSDVLDALIEDALVA